MRRLGIGYDLLTHESAILALDFFTRAFDKLRETGAVRREKDGKNEGCWVMPLSQSEEFAGLEDPEAGAEEKSGSFLPDKVSFSGRGVTLFQWDRSLTMDAATNDMTIDGAVKMTHRPSSGADLVQLDAERDLLLAAARLGRGLFLCLHVRCPPRVDGRPW